MRLEQRIPIFVGAFGSGKTEIALNYAMQLAGTGKRVAIVDLDIVTPYFRSRDVSLQLARSGVEVIAPTGELAQADLPVIIPRVQGVLADPELTVIVDVGGDDAGATALGRFSDQLKKLPHALLLVVNTCRPFTRDATGIANMLAAIERSARLKVTGLVANTNLGAETTPEIVEKGLAIVQEAGRALRVPVVGMGVRKDLAGQVAAPGVPIFPLQIMLVPPWQSLQVITRDRRAVMAAQARSQGNAQKK